MLAALLAFCTLPSEADVRDALRACVGTSHNGMVRRLPIKGVGPFEMVVISDCDLPNTALNPNVSFDHVDVGMSRRTAYVQSEDGSWGIRILFTNEISNELHLYDRVRLNLDGCRISEDISTGALTVYDVTPLNVLGVKAGSPVAAKERSIKDVTDEDIYTLVCLKNVEFVFREAAIVNIDERFSQYSPELHSGIASKINGFADGACCPLRDADGNSIYMAVNTLCPWRRNAAPLGSGDVTGVICVEKNLRYGDKTPKRYIRPMDADCIKVSDSRKSAAWKTYLGWFPGRIPGDYFDFEKSGNTKSGIDDRLLNNAGPKAFLWTDSGERRIQKASSFNSLAFPDGLEPGGSIKLYGTLDTWYSWNADETVADTKSIFVEFNARKVKASALQFGFEICAGDGNILNTRGIPTRWHVGCSINGGPWRYLDEADGSDSFGLRPTPAESKFDSKYNRTYNLMYANGLGLQGHLYNLPAEAIGAESVILRITPAEARWFHLSGDPARDVEFPDATTNLVKKNNKTYSTVRLGTVFIDYKPL